MMSLAIKTTLISLTLGVAMLALAGTASASHVKVDISAPQQGAVGDAIRVDATLRSADTGLPLANTPVSFYTEGSFGGVTGEIELGRAVTDQNGIATLSYQPRSVGDHEIRISYVAPGESEPEVAVTTISVAGASQLHRSTAGIQVPGLNVWLIMAVLTIVWSILFIIGLHIVAIARAGSDVAPVPVPSEPALRPLGMEGQTAAREAGTFGGIRADS